MLHCAVGAKEGRAKARENQMLIFSTGCVAGKMVLFTTMVEGP